MGWIYLTIAGILEIGWIISMKHVEGFTRFVPIIFYVLFGAGSAFFLSLSLKTLPLAVAYVIWMGIGLIGAVVYGWIWLGETMHTVKIVCMVLIMIGIVGLRVATDTSPAKSHDTTIESIESTD